MRIQCVIRLTALLLLGCQPQPDTDARLAMPRYLCEAYQKCMAAVK
jgi:hypothetical protein